jgi:type II secretory pathway component PulK
MGKGRNQLTGEVSERESPLHLGGCAVGRLVPDSSSPRAGSVLILAVWALFFLGILAVAVGTHVASGIRVAVALRHRTRAYALARGGVDLASMHVVANTNRWDGLAEGCWNCEPDLFYRNVTLGDGAFSVSFTQTAPNGEVITSYGLAGEERKININKAPRALLVSFLEIVGEKERGPAEEIAAAIASWREAVDDPVLTRDEETQYYAGLDRPYECHHGDFAALQELRLVRGIDAGLYEKIAPYVTLYGSGKINANGAPKAVLQAAAESRGVRGPNATLLVDEMMRLRPQEKILDFYKELSDKAKRHFGPVEKILTVRSSSFYGEAHGYVTLPEERSGMGGEVVPDLAERSIAFVVNKDGNILYWHEQ